VDYQGIFPEPNGTQNLNGTQILVVVRLGQEQAEHPHTILTLGKQILVGNQQDKTNLNSRVIDAAALTHSDFPFTAHCMALTAAPRTNWKSQEHLLPCGTHALGPGPCSSKHLQRKEKVEILEYCLVLLKIAFRMLY